MSINEVLSSLGPMEFIHPKVTFNLWRRLYVAQILTISENTARQALHPC